ncbi:hypothetical protein BDY24DRAFT_343516, partial [Mrakia frigida]|uniref:uncharacterized protein n=1 Tax=Mrakia frigida TaxID=29902 RepID=UPI003FCC1034
NGYFDGKVLSRSHAEVWFEDGKFLIRDLGSVNGTYLKSERLSPFGRGLPSHPQELHSDDLLVRSSFPFCP